MKYERNLPNEGWIELQQNEFSSFLFYFSDSRMKMRIKDLIFKASTCLLNNLQSKDNFFATSVDWLHDVLFKKPLYLALHEILVSCYMSQFDNEKKLNSEYTLYVR